ncbi:MAG: hypothetical protein AAGH71_05845, partial [Planctomycetota bacterium]
LEMRSATTNSGRLAAASNSILEVIGGTVITQPSGEIVAENGGVVSLLGNSSILGGTVTSEGSGLVQTVSGTSAFESVSVGGDFRIQPASTVNVSGTGLTNDGQIDMNPAASSSNAVLNFAQSGAIDGTGTIRMRTSLDNAQIIAAPGQSITHAASHTIRGVGRIDAPVTNDGTISADVAVSVSGNNLELRINDKVNNGLISAEGSTFLDIESIAIDQTGGGEIRAESAGVVGFFGDTSVTGGEINAIGGGFYDFESTANTTLTDVTLSGNGRISPNGEAILAGGGITNNGLLEINRDASSINALLTSAAPVTIGGTGEIQMRTFSDNAQINTSGSGVIIHGADHLIRGVGWINAALVNEGIISADVAVSVSGNELTLRTEDKTNNNTITAELNTRLDIDAITITQGAGGMILANDGLVNLGGGTRIENGMIASNGTGFISNDTGTQQLSGVNFMGDMRFSPGSTVIVDSVGLTNDGVIQMNPAASSSNAVLELDDATIDGTGEIQMRTSADNSEIRSAAGTTGTLGSGQLVRGVGRMQGDLVNNGEIRADVSVSVSGATFEIITDSMINNGDLTSRPGTTLFLDNLIDQTGGGEVRAEGGVVALNGGLELVGGILDASGPLVGGQPAWGTVATSSVEGTVLSGNGFVNAGDTLEVRGGTLTNNGTIDVNNQQSSSDGVIRLPENTTFNGTGSVRFQTAGANSRISAVADSDAELTNGAGHTIEGRGEIQVPFTNEGILAPGFENGAFGTINATEGFENASNGTYVARIGNNFANGALVVEGTATLAGTLDIEIIDPAVLTIGFTHVIIGADQIVGRFDTFNPILSGDGQFITRVVYAEDSVSILTRCLGDVNLDGVTDDSDFFAWVTNFVADPRSEDELSACDVNLDGACTDSDFFAWVTAFINGC